MDKKNKNLDDLEMELDDFDDNHDLDDYLEDEYEDLKSDDDWEDEFEQEDKKNEKKKGGKAIFIIILLLIIGGGGFYFWTTIKKTDYMDQFNKIVDVKDTLEEQIKQSEAITDNNDVDSLIIDDLPPAPDSFTTETETSDNEIELDISDIPEAEKVESEIIFEEIPDENISEMEFTIPEDITDEQQINKNSSSDDNIDEKTIDDMEAAKTIEQMDKIDSLAENNSNINLNLPKADDIIKTKADDPKIKIDEYESKISTLLSKIENLEEQLNSNIQQDEDNKQIIKNLENTISNMERKMEVMEKEASMNAKLLSEAKNIQKDLLKKLESKASAQSTNKANHNIKRPKAKNQQPAINTAPIKWVLKSAKPGRAWISKLGQNDIIVVEKGMKVPGLGTIKSISIIDGKWTVKGTIANVTQ